MNDDDEIYAEIARLVDALAPYTEVSGAVHNMDTTTRTSLSGSGVIDLRIRIDGHLRIQVAFYRSYNYGILNYTVYHEQALQVKNFTQLVETTLSCIEREVAFEHTQHS